MNYNTGDSFRDALIDCVNYETLIIIANSRLTKQDKEAISSINSSLINTKATSDKGNTVYVDIIWITLNSILASRGIDITKDRLSQSAPEEIEFLVTTAGVDWDEITALIRKPYIQIFIASNPVNFGRELASLATLTLISDLPAAIFKTWKNLSGDAMTDRPNCYLSSLKLNPHYEEIMSYEFVKLVASSVPQWDASGYEIIASEFLMIASKNLLERISVASQANEMFSALNSTNTKFALILNDLLDEFRHDRGLQGMPNAWAEEIAKAELELSWRYKNDCEAG